MDLKLSWDLFTIVFFALVVTYSFIIGKKESVKIIIASYIAIVAVQALGNAMQRLLGISDAQSMFATLGLPVDTMVTTIIKITVFIAIIVFLAVRSGFHVQYAHDGNMVINLVLTGLSGFATAALLLTTLFTYIAGLPLLDPNLATSPALSGVVKASTLMQLMIENQDLWFILPAGILIAAGFVSNK